MRAGSHYSDFKLVSSVRNARFELVNAKAMPFNCSTQGGRAKVLLYNCSQFLKFDYFGENRVGGDNKLQLTCNSVCLAQGLYHTPLV